MLVALFVSLRFGLATTAIADSSLATVHDRSAPPLRLPITPHSSPLPPVPPTFDRFKKVKNVSKILPQMQLHVTPRACPPDRCSRQVPVAANYESVEKSIKAIYRDLFALHSIGYVGCHSAMLGTETLRVAAANLGTFSTEGMSDFEKTSLIDSAYKSWVDRPTQSSLGLLAFQEVVPRVLEYLVRSADFARRYLKLTKTPRFRNGLITKRLAERKLPVYAISLIWSIIWNDSLSAAPKISRLPKYNRWTWPVSTTGFRASTKRSGRNSIQESSVGKCGRASGKAASLNS